MNKKYDNYRVCLWALLDILLIIAATKPTLIIWHGVHLTHSYWTHCQGNTAVEATNRKRDRNELHHTPIAVEILSIQHYTISYAQVSHLSQWKS